jgi:hypothetical protein
MIDTNKGRIELADRKTTNKIWSKSQDGEIGRWYTLIIK